MILARDRRDVGRPALNCLNGSGFGGGGVADVGNLRACMELHSRRIARDYRTGPDRRTCAGPAPIHSVGLSPVDDKRAYDGPFSRALAGIRLRFDAP